jgi:hypothetical protein
MGLMDKLTAGAERAAKEAEKAFDKGKAKVGELQTEMQMDGLAKKLGYLVFDFYRGREVDQALRQKILDDLSRLEDQLIQARAEAAAKAQAEAATRTQGAAPQPAPGEAAQATSGTPTDTAAEHSAQPEGAIHDSGDMGEQTEDDEFAPPAAS